MARRVTPIVNRTDEERERLVSENVRLVLKQLQRYRGLGLGDNDLRAAGNVGLLHAVDRFDDTRGLRFSTYAVNCIRGYMARAVRENQCAQNGVRRHDWDDHLKRVRRGEVELDELGLQVTSFSALAYDNGDPFWEELHVDVEGVSYGADPLQEMMRREESQEQESQLERLLRHLSPRQRQVIELRWLREPPLTYDEIRQEMGWTCSRQRVNHLEQAGLRNLRQWARNYQMEISL